MWQKQMENRIIEETCKMEWEVWGVSHLSLRKKRGRRGGEWVLGEHEVVSKKEGTELMKNTNLQI